MVRKRFIVALIATLALAGIVKAETTITQDETGKVIIIPSQSGTALSDAALLQSRLAGDGTDFIWMSTANGVRIAVLGDTDPRKVCELADNYPDANVATVVNYQTTITALCN